MTLVKSILQVLIGVLLILSIPLIAMQFSDEVNWTRSDFVVGGAILFFFGFLLDQALRRAKSFRQKVWVILGIVFVFLLVWGELAVGIFGTPFAGS